MRIATHSPIAFAIMAALALWTTAAAADPVPTLRVVEPVAFPTSGGTYALTVRADVLTGNTRIFGSGTRIALQFDDLRTMFACVKSGNTPLPDGCDLPMTLNGGNEAAISGISAKLAGQDGSLIGQHKLTVVVPAAGAVPELTTTAQVAFSWVGRNTPRWSAAIASLLLVGLVLALLRAGGRRTLPNGATIGLLQAAFLDPDTNAYSLSKLQFYIWSFSIVAGYLYLTLARSMVQGYAQLADLPQNLPILLAISVGTSVAAVGVSSLIGSKGAGDFHPSASDLITSGGVVAPERLQHLLWSIVGSLGFLFFAFAIDPARIADLPVLPDGFVQLMGLSAAGYVAGKVARGPGPNIRSVTGVIDAAAGTIDLTTDGANMDTNASFLLSAPGGQDTPLRTQPDPARSIYDNNGKTASRFVFLDVPRPAGPPAPPTPTPTPTPVPKPVTTPPAGTSPGGPVTMGPTTNRWRFTIVNQDGEKAQWEFDPT